MVQPGRDPDLAQEALGAEQLGEIAARRTLSATTRSCLKSRAR